MLTGTWWDYHGSIAYIVELRRLACPGHRSLTAPSDRLRQCGQMDVCDVIEHIWPYNVKLQTYSKEPVQIIVKPHVTVNQVAKLDRYPVLATIQQVRVHYFQPENGKAHLLGKELPMMTVDFHGALRTGLTLECGKYVMTLYQRTHHVCQVINQSTVWLSCMFDYLVWIIIVQRSPWDPSSITWNSPSKLRYMEWQGDLESTLPASENGSCRQMAHEKWNQTVINI